VEAFSGAAKHTKGAPAITRLEGLIKVEGEMRYRRLTRRLAHGPQRTGVFATSSCRFERLPNLKPPALPGDTY
jgi:hypothetical protein